MKDYHSLFPAEAEQYHIYQKKGKASGADKRKSYSSIKTLTRDSLMSITSEMDSDGNSSSENEQADGEEEGDSAHNELSHSQNLKSHKKKLLCSTLGKSKQSKNSLISPQKRKLSAQKNSQFKRLKSKTGYRRVDVSQTSPSKVVKRKLDKPFTKRCRIVNFK